MIKAEEPSPCLHYLSKLLYFKIFCFIYQFILVFDSTAPPLPGSREDFAEKTSALIFGEITLIMVIFQKMKGNKEDGIPFLQL